MGFTTRAYIARKGAILGSAVLALELFGSSGAWAQCTDNFNFRAANVPSPGQFAPVSVLAPLGTGSSLSAFISTINSVNTAFLTNTSAFVSAPGRPQPDQQGGGVWGRPSESTAERGEEFLQWATTAVVNLVRDMDDVHDRIGVRA